MLSSFKYLLGQFILSYVFVVAAVIIDFVLAITLPMRRFGMKRQHRKLVASLTYLHWSLIPGIAQWWSDVQVVLHAHPEDMKKFGKEKAILVMNHKYQLDWVAIWILALHYDVLQNFKAIVKSSIKYVPVVGWALWLNESIFVNRNAKSDQKILSKTFENISTLTTNYWLLLFCEGTRLTHEKHKVSTEFAVKKGLKPLKHHLTPRTKGFVYARKALDKEVPAVYDVTVVCPGEKLPTLADFTSGKYTKIDILIRRILLENVPRDDVACSEYVHQLYRLKDDLCEFHKNNGRFPGEEDDPMYEGFVKEKVENNRRSLIIGIVWAILLLPPLFIFFLSLIASGTWIQLLLCAVVTLVVVSVTSQVMLKSGSVSSSYGQKC